MMIDTLDEGDYELRISTRRRSEVFHFKYLWLDKPSTLRDFEMALSLFKYIAPDSVYLKLNSGTEAEKKEKFDFFWKDRDPTPETAYNEVEAQYYERVYYANREFATLRNSNGAFTDRGKAFILFGKPGSVQRELRNDGTYEMWNYPNLKRSLVFKERGFGEFKLYQTERL